MYRAFAACGSGPPVFWKHLGLLEGCARCFCTCRVKPSNAHLFLSVLGKTSRSAFQCLQKFQQYNKTLKRKEWTEEEDHMLTQLVQEMRVGNHIPYRKSKPTTSNSIFQFIELLQVLVA